MSRNYFYCILPHSTDLGDVIVFFFFRKSLMRKSWRVSQWWSTDAMQEEHFPGMSTAKNSCLIHAFCCFTANVIWEADSTCQWILIYFIKWSTSASRVIACAETVLGFGRFIDKNRVRFGFMLCLHVFRRLSAAPSNSICAFLWTTEWYQILFCTLVPSLWYMWLSSSMRTLIADISGTLSFHSASQFYVDVSSEIVNL